MSDSQRARLAAISLDCPQPSRLADFYRELLGARTLWANDSSAGIDIDGVCLVAQRVDDYARPTWPGASIVHLDLTADDLDATADRAISLGATTPTQPDRRWRVLLDPAGHPFCLTPFTPESAD